MPYTFFYDGKFYFCLRKPIAILDWAQLWCDWRSHHRRSSSTEGRLPPKVILHRCSSSTDGRLPPKLVFHWRSSSTDGWHPLKGIFHRTSPSTEGCLPPTVVFHRRSYSAEGYLSPKAFCSSYHNTLVDFTFVSTANIPNLSLLPCLEVA